jgi:hypothetical protein
MASMMLASRMGAVSAFGTTRPSVAARCPLTVTCAYGSATKVGGGKKWVHTEVNHNGKPVKVKMHVKKGDMVQVRGRLVERGRSRL